MKDSLDTTHEITKLIKKSPVLCPTRWKVRADSLKSILDNFEVLQELWEETIDSVKDTFFFFFIFYFFLFLFFYCFADKQTGEAN